jgi:hypothetical protein
MAIVRALVAPSFFLPLCWYFNFFPLGGTTEFVGGFKKHHLRHLLVPHNIFAKKPTKKLDFFENIVFPVYFDFYKILCGNNRWR